MGIALEIKLTAALIAPAVLIQIRSDRSHVQAQCLFRTKKDRCHFALIRKTVSE
jgi:uncharacterized membrane protein